MVEGPPLAERGTSTGLVRRRDVLIAGAVGTGTLLVHPIGTLAAQPAGLDHAVRELMSAGRLPGSGLPGFRPRRPSRAWYRNGWSILRRPAHLARYV